nr:FkbM family methyltransferase [Brevibacillus sp. SYP-B805]
MSATPEHMQKVTIAGSSNVLYVNPTDKRGQWVIKSNGVTHHKVTSIWRKIVEVWKPTIILDVGVNYGEVIYSTVYHPDAKIIGIEANQLLFPYLCRALEEHPNKSQITLVHALAGEKEGEEITFYVDHAWSGTSSAVPMMKHKMVEVTKVKSITVDSLFADQSLAEERLLFKLDVEGFEAYVLKGMARIREQCPNLIGYIEFNDEWLTKAGTDVDQFLVFLSDHFHVYLHQSNTILLRFQDLRLENLKPFFTSYTDLLLTSKAELAEQVGLPVRTIS